MSYKPGMYQHPGYATLVAEQEAIRQDLQQLETERKQAMSDREKFEQIARELLALNAMQGTTLGIVAIADTIEKAVAEKQIMLGNADAIIGAQVETITEKQAEIGRLKAELERVTGEREAADMLAKMVAVCARCGSYKFASRSCSLCLTKERDTLRAQLEAMTENRDHFCHHINLIAKELGTDKDNSAPEAVLRWVQTQKAQLEEALALMDAKAKVFRSYEALHLAKLTDAGMIKANENRNHACDLEAFLQKVNEKETGPIKV